MAQDPNFNLLVANLDRVFVLLDDGRLLPLELNGAIQVLRFQRVEKGEINVFVGDDLLIQVNTKETLVAENGRAVEAREMSQQDLINILNAYNQKYGKPLAKEIQSEPIELYVHLDEDIQALPDGMQRSVIQTLIGTILQRSRTANYRAIHFTGLLGEMAYKISQEMGGQRKELFIEDLPVRFPEARQQHLLSEKEHLKLIASGQKIQNHRYISMKNIEYNKNAEHPTVDLVTFQPAFSFLDAVAAMKNLSKEDPNFNEAHRIYEEFTGIKLSADEFLGFLQGVPEMVQKFSLPPALRAIDVNLAMHVAGIQARMALQAA